MDILKLGGTYEFIFTTHDPSTAAVTDVDGDTFTTSTYENAVDGSMYAPSISQVQDGLGGDVTGTYRCVVVATGANGFETGKRYNVVTEYDIGGVPQSAPVATFQLLTYNLDDIMAMIGTAVALDGGGATIAGMLTKIADDNGGASFNAEFDSLNKISDAVDVVDGNVDDIETLLGTVDGKIDTIDGNVDDIETAIGTPVALDGGTASIAGMLTKMADDNGGADYDAGTDSLHEVSHKVDPSAIADDVWDALRADHTDLGSFGEVVPADAIMVSGDATAAGFLRLQYNGTGVIGDEFPARQDQVADIYADTQRVDGLIEDDGHGLDRFTAKALEEAPTGATASEVWEYTPTGLEPANSTAEIITDILEDTDRVDGLIEDDGLGNDRFTEKALEHVEALAWDATMADHLTPGSTGAALDSAAGGAASTWEELTEDHLNIGSFGLLLATWQRPAVQYFSKARAERVRVELPEIILTLIDNVGHLVGGSYEFTYLDVNGISHAPLAVDRATTDGVVELAGGAAASSPYTLTFTASNGTDEWSTVVAMVTVTSE